MTSRDTHRYHFIKGRKIVHRGVTNDLDRRESEHRQTYGDGKIKPIGPQSHTGVRSRMGAERRQAPLSPNPPIEA